MKKNREGKIINLIEILNSRLSFSWRMMVTTVVPMISILILSFLTSVNAFQEYQSLNKLEGLNNLIEEVSSVIHNLQIERGLTTGYLSSSQKPFMEELNQQRVITDLSLSAMNQVLKQLPKYLMNEEITRHRDNILVLPARIQQIRSSISLANSFLGDVTTFYTDEIAYLLDLFNGLILPTLGQELTSSLTANIAILNLKESMGQERALGTKVIEQESTAINDLANLYVLIGQQQAFLRNFNQVATKKQKSIWLDYDTTSTSNLTREAEQNLLQFANAGMLSDMNSKEWFTTFTDRINQLLTVSDLLISGFQLTVHNKIDQLSVRFFLSLLSLAFLFVITISFSWLLNRRD